ncbi:hypothetical protein GBA52_025078, partial [Prunus armeniaca]
LLVNQLEPLTEQKLIGGNLQLPTIIPAKPPAKPEVALAKLTAKLGPVNRYHNLEYVDERHRHRYVVGCNLLQVNPDVIGILEEAGLKFLCSLVILELPSHPFYVGGNFIQNLNHGLGSPQLSF